MSTQIENIYISDDTYNIISEFQEKYSFLSNVVKDMLKPSRYSHTMGVIELSVELALRYGESTEESYLAALFHDYMKYIGDEESRKYLDDMGLMCKIEPCEDLKLYHGVIAAHVLESKFSDEIIEILGSGKAFNRILNAIRYHTYGRKHMSILDKIIYVADAAEKGRNYKGVEHIRKIMYDDIDTALLISVDGTIRFVVEKGEYLNLNSVKMRNRLIFDVMRK